MRNCTAMFALLMLAAASAPAAAGEAGPAEAAGDALRLSRSCPVLSRLDLGAEQVRELDRIGEEVLAKKRESVGDGQLTGEARQKLEALGLELLTRTRAALTAGQRVRWEAGWEIVGECGEKVAAAEEEAARLEAAGDAAKAGAARERARTLVAERDKLLDEKVGPRRTAQPAGAAAPQAPAGGVTVDELVRMKESGWSDELMIKMVKTKGVGFDPSVENLNRLREKKLGDAVLMAVIEAGAARTAPAVPSPASPEPVTEKPAVPPVQPDPPPVAGPGPGAADPGPAAPLPPGPAPRKKCATCGSRGILPCPGHRPADFVVTSAMAAPPQCCRGIGWIKCPACGDQASDALLEQLSRELTARMAEWPRMDKASEQKLFHGETRHLAMDTDLSPADAAKLAGQCEGLLLKLRGLFRNDEFEFTRPATMRICSIGRVDGFVKFIDWFGPYARFTPEQRLRLAQSHGMTVYGGCGYSLTVRERTGRDYASYVINGFGHVLAMHAWGFKGRLPGWISEGFGSFCETLELGKPNVWNFDYDPKNLEFGADWKDAVRKAVAAGKTVPLEHLVVKGLSEMKPLDYQQAWSLTGALVYGGPDKYQQFLKAVKDRQDQVEALEKAYGAKLPQIEATWKNYALNQR